MVQSHNYCHQHNQRQVKCKEKLILVVREFLFFFFFIVREFQHSSFLGLMAQMVKNLPAMQETGFLSLGQEDLLGKGMASHSGILAWRIPRTEEPGGLQSRGSQRVRHDEVTNTLTFILKSRRRIFFRLCLTGKAFVFSTQSL